MPYHRDDPPEVDEVPECCNEVMTVDDKGNCTCKYCGKFIAAPVDIEPLPSDLPTAP